MIMNRYYKPNVIQACERTLAYIYDKRERAHERFVLNLVGKKKSFWSKKVWTREEAEKEEHMCRNGAWVSHWNQVEVMSGSLERLCLDIEDCAKASADDHFNLSLDTASRLHW